ncbi:hypothetical protein ACFSO0_10970 [Brevibacillus sp. GCM10020057]|uniref:putative ABC transporter permease subunit n=1 Tax=Brevibacillus sp. GCM10020057 TaxID=3317327 RepID=UPI0036385F3E
MNKGMKKVLLLTKIILKNAGSPLKWRGSGWKSYWILFAVAAGMIPLIASVSAFSSSLYDGLAQIGQEGALLGIGVAGSSLAIFLLGIVYVLSVFYYSQDVEHLLPLPLTPGQILGAKFLVALLYEYLTALVMVMPIFVTFGIKSGGGVLYYLYALVVYLVLPIVPLALAILVVMVFMRYTNIGKSKDRIRLIGGLLAIAAAIGFQAFAQRQASGTGGLEQLQQMIAAQNQGLVGIVTRIFPASKFAALALLENSAISGFGYLVAYCLVAAVSFAAIMWAGSYLYFAGVMGISESRARRRQLDETAWRKGFKARPVWLAYAAKEWKMLVRTPAFLMNCALPSLFMPLFGLVPLLSRHDSGELLAALGDWLQGEGMGGMSVALFFGLFLLVAGTNSTSVTAITREGQGFFLNKSLPVPYGQLLAAKLIPGFALSVFSMLLLAGEAAWLIQLPPLFVILAVAVGIPGIFFMHLLGLMLDLRNPKLEWGSEQEAVKQNLSPLFFMILGVVTAGLAIGAAYLLQTSLVAMGAGLLLVFALADFALWRLLMKKGPVWLEQIEG